MPRAQALGVIRAAGAENNQSLFIRTYLENRISYPVAIREFRAGRQWAQRISKGNAK